MAFGSSFLGPLQSMTRYWKILGGLLAVFVVGTLATPKLLSTDYVKQRVAAQLSSITGRTVVLNGDSAIGLYPYLSVSYRDVSIRDANNTSPEPLARMDALRAKLSIFAAFWGTARLAELDFVRPVINLRVDQTGAENWAITQGPLAERLALPTDETPEKLTLGSISFENGIVTFNHEPQRWTEEFTDVNGTLNWPELQAPASLNGSAVWRGEVLSFNANAEALFDLLKGRESALNLTVNSKPVNFNFQGRFNLSAQTASGEVKLGTPSASRVSNWLGSPIDALGLLGKVVLEGDLNLGPEKAEFSNLSVSSDDHTGVGRLLIRKSEDGEPQLSGTLAFDTFSFPDIEALLQSEGSDQQNLGLMLTKVLKGYGLDMRLSANRAQLGSHELTGVAAAALVKDGEATFDIGQAEMFGGTVAASVSLSSANKMPSYAMTATLTDADFESLAALHGSSSYKLEGKGNVQFNLKSSGSTLQDMLVRLNGSAKLESQDGVLNGLNLADVLGAANKEASGIWQAVSGTTPYQNLALNVSIANGIAVFNDCKLANDMLEASLTGKSDLVERSLALRGTLMGSNTPEDVKNSLPFFVGGTTSAPLFVPLFARSKQAPAVANSVEN